MNTEITQGASLSFDNQQYDLSRVSVGLGWDMRKKDSLGLWDKLKGQKTPPDYDLDVVAFLLDKRDKIANLGHNAEVEKGRVVPLVGSDVIHFNNLSLPDGTVRHSGDNPDGKGAGDDEKILLNLNELKPDYHRILFIASIFKAQARDQHFGMVHNAFIRALDAQGEEIVRYNLSEAPEYEKMCSMIFGEFFRQGNGWGFRALGKAYSSDSFVDIMRDYVDFGG
jgi:tellurium resistance protein TerD